MFHWLNKYLFLRDPNQRTPAQEVQYENSIAVLWTVSETCTNIHVRTVSIHFKIIFFPLLAKEYLANSKQPLNQWLLTCKSTIKVHLQRKQTKGNRYKWNLHRKCVRRKSRSGHVCYSDCKQNIYCLSYEFWDITYAERSDHGFYLIFLATGMIWSGILHFSDESLLYFT